MSSELFSVGRKAHNAYARDCQPVCRQYAVNQTGLDLLLFLDTHPDRNTARDLCVVQGAKSGIVSVTVDALIRQGYLSCVEDAADRRIHRLYPTDAARPLIAAASGVQRAFFEAVTEGVSPAELDTYRAITQKLIENIEKMDKGGKEAC